MTRWTSSAPVSIGPRRAVPPPKGPDKIAIPAAARERVKVVANRLKRTMPQRGAEEFVGPILRVERHPDADTGAVTVQASRNGHPAHVTVNVSARCLADAWNWARDRETVYIESRVHRTITGLFGEIFDAVTPLKARYLPEG